MSEKNIQYQVGLKFKPSVTVKALILRLLQSAGFDMTTLVDEEDRCQWMLSFYVYDKKALKAIRASLRSIRLKGVVCFTKEHHKDVWSVQWKKGWKPFELTKRFYVIPLWQERRSYPKGMIPLYLDTTNAFGTGLHETTKFTSQIIDSLQGRFETFLDVGTGTGLLAIVALKSGARRAVGFDIDPGAVVAARQNLKANGLKAVLKTCTVEKFVPVKKFDLVAANLVSPDLIEFRDRIISFTRSGGWLVVSGISLVNIARVKKAFNVPSLKLLKVVKGKEWAAILFKIRDENE